MKLSRFPYRLKAIQAIILGLIISVLQACGLPSEQGGSDGSSSQIDNEVSGGTGDPELTLGKVLIIQAERLNGGTDLNLNNVSLVSLNADFREISDGSIPEWKVTRSEVTDNIELSIESNYVEQLNHVIKIRYSNDEIYYASLPYIPVQVNSTAETTVNIFTHYIVKKLFDLIPDSDSLLSHLPCETGDPVVGCNNQPRVKQDYLAMVNKAAAEFSFDLTTSNSISQALTRLDERAEIKRYVDFALRDLTHTEAPFAQGTMRSTNLGFDSEGNVLGFPAPWSKRYNSVFFALSLSDLEPNSELIETIGLAASNSTIVGNKELSNELPAYPYYENTTYLYELRRESALFIDIPYERTSLTVKNVDSKILDRSEPINTYASESTVDSFLSREGFLLEGRTLVTPRPGDASDEKDIAWRYEPVFADLYQANEYEPETVFVQNEEEEETIDFGNEPTWLISSNFGKAANYEIRDAGTANESLGVQLEDINLFSWELHGLQTPTTFSTSRLSGKSYGVISFSQKLNDAESENNIEMFGETMKWTASSSLFSIEQPLLEDHYRTHTISRDDDNTPQSLTTQRGLVEASRSYFAEGTESADPNAENGIAIENRGILKLDGGIEAPIGHATDNGGYFAFSFNTSDTSSITDRGTGIIIGTELNTVSPVFPDPDDSEQFVYQIQGNSMEILDNSNSLKNLTGSTLLVTNKPGDASKDCEATLKLTTVSVRHSLDSVANLLTEPAPGGQSDIISSSCRINLNEIEIGFANVLGQALTLKGFISKSDAEFNTVPGNVMTLLWLQENSIGLLFAGKTQNKKAVFE